MKRKEYPFVGCIDFQGMVIHVENKRGSKRRGIDPDGKPWSIDMLHHYGEIEGTEGADGDPLDVYVGPNRNSPLAVVVHQQDPDTGEYDEDKAMVGFDSVPKALAAYRAQYNRRGFYQSHTAMPVAQLLTWCECGKNRGKRVTKAIVRPGGQSVVGALRAAGFSEARRRTLLSRLR